MTLAHVASVPLEELLLLAPAASALWLAIRAGAHASPRRAIGSGYRDARPSDWTLGGCVPRVVARVLPLPLGSRSDQQGEQHGEDHLRAL
jgi:hypothetical protein